MKSKILKFLTLAAALCGATAWGTTVAKVGETDYGTLEAAIAAAEPVDGVVTYEICGKAEVSATGWIQVLKSGLSNVKKVAFVGTTEDAEISIAGDLAILADQQYDIDVSFSNLKLSKPNPKYGGDLRPQHEVLHDVAPQHGRGGKHGHLRKLHVPQWSVQ